MKPETHTTAVDRAGFAATLRAGAVALDLALTETQVERLLDYLALIGKWNAVYNLTAIRDPAQMVKQHLLDSLAAVSEFYGARRVLDVGAGAGLPGVVLAIWAQVAQPAMRIALVDTVKKKTAFLTQVKAELGLSNVIVHHARVEEMQADADYDVITSRAFAELSDFIAWSAHLLAPDGRFIAMKGVAPHEEIARLPPGWVIEAVRPLHVPTLDAERHLICIRRAGTPSLLT